MSKITVIPNPKTVKTKRYDELKPGHYYRCVNSPEINCESYVNWIGQAIDFTTYNEKTKWYLVWSNGKGYFSTLTCSYEQFRFVEIDVEIKEV